MAGGNENGDDAFPGIPLGDGQFLVGDEFFKDAVLFRPGMPDLGSYAGYEIARAEHVTCDTVLKPVDVVIFFDPHSKNPIDELGCNQWAFVVDEEKALFSRRLVHAITLIKLRAHPEAIAIRRIPPEFSDCVADFLMRYRWRPALFKAAVNFLQCTNYMPFLSGSFFPPDVEYVTDMEYDEAWRRMIAALEPHDLILTFDRTSSLSKIIALCTHGPFSHVATYVGEGKIWEIVTSGARVVPIEHYKYRHKYRVAAYRHFGHEPMTRDEQLADMMSVVGNVRYGYLGALWGGIKSYFGYHRDQQLRTD